MRASGRDFHLLTTFKDHTVEAQLPCSFQAKCILRPEESQRKAIAGLSRCNRLCIQKCRHWGNHSLLTIDSQRSDEGKDGGEGPVPLAIQEQELGTFLPPRRGWMSHHRGTTGIGRL